MRSIFTIAKVPVLLLVPFLYVSCATYNQKIQKYYSKMEAGRYQAAFSSLDHIKFLQKPRNHFLYFAEKGRMAHLMGLYDSSNYFLNQADRIAEIRYRSAGDVAVSTVLNPMMQTYHGEAFERFMLHYYKALNYAYLGNTEAALVEARRITLASNEQLDQTNGKDNRYSRDAFSQNLQGIIYDMAGDVNNAFIAYRNAVETYLSQESKSWYGVHMPLQLKKDLLRTAEQNGFASERERYERLFNIEYAETPRAEGGELVVFIESGRAPVKEEESIMFSLIKGAGGSFFFADPTGAINIPFDMARYNTKNAGIGDLRTFRVALPKYMVVSSQPERADIRVNDSLFRTEMVQNMNVVAQETMKERRLKDITAALTRLAVKKLAEAGARAASTSIAKSNDKDKEKDESKSDAKAEAIGTAVGLIFQAASMASEKADTRNWQSLPAFIQYTRVPLKNGSNTVYLDNKTIEVIGTGHLKMMNLHL